MAQLTLRGSREHASPPEDHRILPVRGPLPSRSHVLVLKSRVEADNVPDCSGRLFLADEFEIPDLDIFSHWNGR